MLRRHDERRVKHAMTKKVKRPVGRPTKYSPERVRQVRHLVFEGHTLRDACRASGISPCTYHAWVAEDREGMRASHVRLKHLWASLVMEECEALIDGAFSSDAEREYNRRMRLADKLLGRI